MYNKKIFQFGPEFVILIVLCLFFAVPIQAMTNQTVPDKNEQKVFKAGAARSNITPHLGGIIVGGWVGTEAAYIHDDLHVRTLVLDDGANKLAFVVRSEEHTSELQSRPHLVCRLLLEKKKKNKK